ncbi:MAG TPA: hypothetical protein VMA30_05690 [Xanthobacteraceae bacterium]|nr:hypothetical protein [Xanthobacteraceae bacterium]
MRWTGLACASVGLAVALPLCFAAMNPLAAQPRGSIAPRPSRGSVSTDDQLAPSQINQPIPPAVSEPPSASHPAARASATAEPRAATTRPVLPSGSHTVIACSGPFAQDSGMLSLAMTFGDGNVTFTHEKVQNSEVGATIVYPKDPRRRLEVWWQNPNRTGLFLIDITGKSIWTGPEGLHLGLTLPDIEKRNRKPFKLKGFDKDGVAAVSDWDGGALATLPGGCKASVNFHADPKTAKDAASAMSADHEYSSADPDVRAAKLSVSEILIGY